MQKLQDFCDAVNRSILYCALCNGTLHQPRTLSCQHTFCDSCLRRQPRSILGLKCPTCQQTTILSFTGIDGLPVNTFMDELQSTLEQLLEDTVEASMKSFNCALCHTSSQSKVVVCCACEEDVKEIQANTKLYLRLSQQGMQTQAHHVRYPINRIQKIAYLCRLSYHTQESFFATNCQNGKKAVRPLFRGATAYKSYKFKLQPCMDFEHGVYENQAPDVLYRSMFYCKTCSKLVCRACEFRHRYHHTVPKVNHIVRYINNFQSSPHTVTNANGRTEFASASALDTQLLFMYMRDQDPNALEFQSLDHPNASHISVSDVEQEFLVCSLCSERYIEPKMLPCQHSFCKSCLLKLLPLHLSQGRSAERFPCPECGQEIDFSNGFDQFPNGSFDELMALIDDYNADAERRGDMPSYDLPYRCGICRASCSEVVFLCQGCVDEFRRQVPTTNEQCREAVTMNREVCERIKSHIASVCDASLVLASQTAYHRCQKCNFYFTRLLTCRLCQTTMCRSCIFQFHSFHVGTSRILLLDESAIYQHARSLVTLCDQVNNVNQFIDNLALPQRNVGFFKMWMQQRALLMWMHGPLLQNNQPAFDRRLMAKIWNMRRQASQLKFVDMQTDFQDAEWVSLRFYEAIIHILNNWVPLVMPNAHLFEEAAIKFVLA